MGRGGSLGDVYKSYQKKQSSIAFSSELEQENNFFAVSAWSAHRQLRVQSDFLEGTAFKPMVSVVYTNATQNTQQTSLHLSTLCCATLCSKFSLLKIFVVKIFSYGLHVYENILTRKIVIFNTKISRFTVISFAIIIFCRLVHLNLVTPACYPTAWHHHRIPTAWKRSEQNHPAPQEGRRTMPSGHCCQQGSGPSKQPDRGGEDDGKESVPAACQNHHSLPACMQPPHPEVWASPQWRTKWMPTGFHRRGNSWEASVTPYGRQYGAN